MLCTLYPRSYTKLLLMFKTECKYQNHLYRINKWTFVLACVQCFILSLLFEPEEYAFVWWTPYITNETYPDTTITLSVTVHMYRSVRVSPCLSIHLLNSSYLIILPTYMLAIGSTDAIHLSALKWLLQDKVRQMVTRASSQILVSNKELHRIVILQKLMAVQIVKELCLHWWDKRAHYTLHNSH
jgi:hypothetical protein